MKDENYKENDEYSKFTEVNHNQKVEDTFTYNRYNIVEPRTKRQVVTEVTVLNKKLAKAGRMILSGIACVAILGFLPSIMAKFGLSVDNLVPLRQALAYGWAGLSIGGVLKLSKALHDPVTKEEVEKYQKAVDKKMKKNSRNGSDDEVNRDNPLVR